MVGRRRRLLVAALALIVFPIGVTAAAGKPYLAGGVGFFNLAFDPAPVDPATTYSTPGWQIEYATCAKLVNYPDAAAPDGSLPQLEVAKKDHDLPDGLTYTFRLRNGYMFSPPSNARVTADAFARALDRVRDPVLQSPGQPFFADVVSTTSDGDKTLMIRLAHPSGSFLARLALPFACAVRRHPARRRALPPVVPYCTSAGRLATSPATRPGRGSCCPVTRTTSALGPPISIRS